MIALSDFQPESVLVFAPIGRDAAASVDLLVRSGIPAKACGDLSAFVRALEAGASAAFLAEEALFGTHASSLYKWVADQPPWSDLPFILLTSRQEQMGIEAWRQDLIARLRNVALLERPVQALTLVSALQSAIRARKRQLQLRALLEERERSAQQLEQLVVARTQELEAANTALRAQMRVRAEVEEKLRQAQKIEAIGQLTGGVAHDFNNLLMVISGGLEMLDRQADPARRKRLMDGMRQAAERGSGLTRQLLAFSRRQELKPQTVDLARQIGGMRELLDRSLRGDVHVVIDLSPDLWPVEVDASELELVVLNLAVNARDAMPNGGTIKITAENEAAWAEPSGQGDFVRLVIADDGCGMTPEVQARVFEPFFTTKDVGKGSGLGLAQVHGFAQQSGGKIEIESAVGKGTTISLLLPRSPNRPASDQHHLVDLHVASRRAEPAGNILLVEDDDEVAALVAEMLDELGFQVVRAATAAAALGALANGRTVDLVFSDIMMPGGMNGVELAKEIRLRRNDLPILLTSGYSEAAKQAAEAQGIKILRKPYQLAELEEALRRTMAGGDSS
ncbi:signal transduction histidine kinase/ActR/RegA family two-component response regulator [Neorhizobium galegae]|uniref:ATP-binding protein n=1 Tax=Neorhizobium galegae TaxID=399 RepID=UPI001AE77A35|nr:ATP-binding protein [Neorhizobium galegae]MBP2561914.1 signal transduction histidine kinase/ActR/RegA family two-component response regulator [Neorhizobium galegae]MDQ0134119.1 signal transduction histidine kinase/ActR/RegA family two-component response regulator [Neorhizobium galegae]